MWFDFQLEALMNDFHFMRPWFLILVLPLLLLNFLNRQQSIKNPWSKLINPSLLAAILVKPDIEGTSKLRPRVFALLFGIVWFIALAGPSWQLKPTPLNQDQQKIMILLSLSETMLSDDISPNRLAAAKLKIASLISRYQSKAIGLIVYSGSAHLVLPFSRDHQVLEHYLIGLAPRIMPSDGSNLKAALEIFETTVQDVVLQTDTTVIIVSDGDEVLPSESALISDSYRRFVYWHQLPEQAEQSIDLTQYAQLGFHLLAATANDDDLERLGEYMDDSSSKRQQQDSHAWLDAGYYLVWPLMLLTLLWFRRGMVLAWD